jgi:hypothetical protein
VSADIPGDESPDLSAGDAGAIHEAKETVRSGSARETTLPAHLQHLPERERAQRLDLKKTFADQEHALRQRYAGSILWILALQLLIADLVFIAFAWAGEDWELSSGVMEVWLGATVVQVVGVVFVVTRHLFWNRDGSPARL